MHNKQPGQLTSFTSHSKDKIQFYDASDLKVHIKCKCQQWLMMVHDYAPKILINKNGANSNDPVNLGIVYFCPNINYPN